MTKAAKIFKVSKTELLGLAMASVIASGACAAIVSSTPVHAHTAQTSHICSYAKFASN